MFVVLRNGFVMDRHTSELASGRFCHQSPLRRQCCYDRFWQATEDLSQSNLEFILRLSSCVRPLSELVSVCATVLIALVIDDSHTHLGDLFFQCSSGNNREINTGEEKKNYTKLCSQLKMHSNKKDVFVMEDGAEKKRKKEGLLSLRDFVSTS